MNIGAMEQDGVSVGTEFLRTVGRSLWNEADKSVCFDWSGTQVTFRVLGSPAEVSMSASIGDDVLAIYANGRLQRKIGPRRGLREKHLLLTDAPEDCVVSIVKLSEPNMAIPVMIYDICASPSPQKRDGAPPPSITSDVEGGDPPGLGATVECVGDSDTSALYNMMAKGGCMEGDWSFGSNVEHGWPFFLAESLGLASPPMVCALSGVGVHDGPHREKSLSEYYRRVVCCRDSRQNVRPDNNIGVDTSGPLCVLVFVGGNDLAHMPSHSAEAQRSFLKDFVRAHQALLQAIRHHRPCSPIVSLYTDAESCSGCETVLERELITSTLQQAVIDSVSGLGGAQFGFFSCKVQPNIRTNCPDDWAHDLHWSAIAHRKFARALKRALRDLDLREAGVRLQEQHFAVMTRLAAQLASKAAAGENDSELPVRSTEAEGVKTVGSDSVKIAGMSPLQLAAMGGDSTAVRLQLEHPDVDFLHLGPQSWSALHWAAEEGHEAVCSLLVQDQRFMAASNLDSAAVIVDMGLMAFRRLTPLHLAVDVGHVLVVRALLQSPSFAPFVNAFAEEAPAEISAASVPSRWSALHLAVHRGHTSITECLLRSETLSEGTINSVISHGRTALHMACSAGNEAVVQMLLDEQRFTAVNARAGQFHHAYHLYGFTALTLAVWRGHHDGIARLLLRHHRFHALDAPLVARGPEAQRAARFFGLDALQLMASHGMDDCVQLYLDAHAREKPGVAPRLGAFYFAARQGHEAILRTMAAHPAIDTAAEAAYEHSIRKGATSNALHEACWYGHVRIVQYILGLPGVEGAINATTGKDKASVLNTAIVKHRKDIAVCLLQSERFWAVNLVDCAGHTALHVACESRLEDIAIEIARHPRFVHHHLRCSSSGKTALMMAKECELDSLVDVLSQV